MNEYIDHFLLRVAFQLLDKLLLGLIQAVANKSTFFFCMLPESCGRIVQPEKWREVYVDGWELTRRMCGRNFHFKWRKAFIKLHSEHRRKYIH